MTTAIEAIHRFTTLTKEVRLTNRRLFLSCLLAQPRYSEPTRAFLCVECPQFSEAGPLGFQLQAMPNVLCGVYPLCPPPQKKPPLPSRHGFVAPLHSLGIETLPMHAQVQDFSGFPAPSLTRASPGSKGGSEKVPVVLAEFPNIRKNLMGLDILFATLDRGMLDPHHHIPRMGSHRIRYHSKSLKVSMTSQRSPP